MIMPILAVRDVDATVAFYTDKLGFNHDFSLPGSDGTNTFAGVSLGKASLGFDLQPAATKGGDGVVFMVYVTEDANLDVYYEQVKARGVKIEQEIKDEYWGDRVFGLRDNNGYYLNFCKTVKQMSGEEIAQVAQAQ